MTPLSWVLGLILPACGAAGAAGLPAPAPLDVTRIERPDSPNTALAAPAGFQPRPDIETRVYPVSASRLFDAIRAVARSEPRTFPAGEFPDGRQADYVVRSAVLNFPDLVTVVARDADSPAAGPAPRQAGAGSLVTGEGGAAVPTGSAAAVPTGSAAAVPGGHAAVPTGGDLAFSTLIIWSRSIYGRSDLGVNRSRISDWLEALDRRLASS